MKMREARHRSSRKGEDSERDGDIGDGGGDLCFGTHTDRKMLRGEGARASGAQHSGSNNIRKVLKISRSK